MLNQRYAEASVEVLDILQHMNASDLAKVSNKFINFLQKNASKEYICNLDYSKRLNDMELKQETRGLLALMYEKYWCPVDEREKLKKIFYENERKYQEELREKYNPDKLFKKTNEYDEEKQEKSNIDSMVEYEESLIKRIINKIKAVFRK